MAFKGRIQELHLVLKTDKTPLNPVPQTNLNKLQFNRKILLIQEQ